MSAKWQRIQRWDAEHLTGWLTPVRVVLWWLSSIRLAVMMLVFVSLYAVLASVPVGLLALAPTYLVYGMTLALAALVPGVVGVVVVRAAMAGAARGPRFAASLLTLLVIGAAGAWAWTRAVWPALAYDPASGTGLRFFADFVEAYRGTTVRRLPGLEMTELEFYAWWPLRWALLLFCANLIVATVRRIEFGIKTLGVLTVHTGIITIALGSILYGRFKLEGDTILLAGPPAPGGQVVPGPPQMNFYDNTRVVLYVAQQEGIGGRPVWEQRTIEGLPRYNAYGLDAAEVPGERLSAHAADAKERADGGRTLDLPIGPGDGQFVDPDLQFRVVGYAPYAEVAADWASAPAPATGQANPLREIELYARLPEREGVPSVDPTRAAFRFTLLPAQPARRAADNDVLGLEYTVGLDEARWGLLGTPLPGGGAHALVVRVDGGEPVVVPATPGQTHAVGGVRLTVEALHREPPLALITPGYEGATTSVAVVRVEAGGDTFERWLHYRFPELDQDLRGEREDGRPDRVKADRSIVDVAYLDASRLLVHFDDRPDGTTRAVVREPGGAVRVVEGLGASDRLTDVLPGVDLAVSRRWAHAAVVQHPVPTPEAAQDGEQLGTHEHALLGVEVRSGALPGWREVRWVPFARYLGVQDGEEERVALPDGREVRLAFGRRQHRFPGFAVRMLGFDMVAYDHRGAPRDYQSVVRVEPAPTLRRMESFEPYDHIVKLNAPLRAPFHWDEQASWVSNSIKRLGAGLNPDQFKFSQAGWDQQGWQQTQAMADAGEMDRAFARFTILGVGNNPGIHVIALGGILMAVGIPWAFYVKPWLVRRERERLAARARAQADAARPAPVLQEVGA